MNQLTKQLLCLTALLSAGQVFAIAGAVTKIVPRSQSFNVARQMVSWNQPDWGITVTLKKVNITQASMRSSNTLAHSNLTV